MNKKLQADYDRYGKSAFRFSVIANTVKPCVHALRDLEEQLIEQLQPEYNVNLKPDPVKTPTGKKRKRPPQRRVVITAGGKTLRAFEWARETGINQATIIMRVQLGWTPEEAVGLVPRNQPVRNYENVKKLYIEYNGEKRTLDQWSDITGVPKQTLYQRLYHKWPVGQALGYEKNPADIRKEKAKAKKAIPKRPRGRPRKSV